VLKVLLADANYERALAVQESLEASGGVEIFRALAGENLVACVAALSPDVVIVDMRLPDRDALESIRAIAATNPRPIVMFTDRDDPAFMEEAISAGVSSYNVLGATIPDIKPIVAAAVVLFRRYRQIEEELERAKATLAERLTLDRAKALLMRRRGIGEPEAYRWLRRKAMNENRKIVDVAAELLAREQSDAPPK
jgi:two-component system, response regulator / RNA-binding antiterminator